MEVVEGPPEYLLGEETALLEAIDGRYPFPRIAPPYRRGVDEIVETEGDLTSESGLSAHVEMAGADADTGAPPTLVDNAETLAHVDGRARGRRRLVPRGRHRRVSGNRGVHGERMHDARRRR